MSIKETEHCGREKPETLADILIGKYGFTDGADGSMNIGTWPCFGDQLIPA